MVLALVLIMVAFTALQVAEISQQQHLTIHDHARRLMGKECSESFPVPVGVRIFPDGKEVRHILFLKIHKAASGTATSVFFRFGITRKLKFVLPKYLNIISSSDSIKDKYIHPRLNQSFDIMTSHMIYDRSAITTYLNKDTVYIGILRDPFQQFKSSINYMQPKYVYKLSKESPVQEYLKDPMKHEKANTRGPRFSWINNRQAVEFGFPDEVIMSKNRSAIDRYIQKLDKEFHLVLIAEYFDESIILMRRMLNWSMEDVLYRNLHIRGWDRKNTLPKPRDRIKFRNWAAVDYALYDFFYNRLWQQIKEAGSDFFDEILYFKKIRAEVDDFCKVTPNITGVYSIPKSVWSAEIMIDLEFCKLMFAEEEDFVKMIAQMQYGIKPTKKK